MASTLHRIGIAIAAISGLSMSFAPLASAKSYSYYDQGYNGYPYSYNNSYNGNYNYYGNYNYGNYYNGNYDYGNSYYGNYDYYNDYNYNYNSNNRYRNDYRYTNNYRYRTDSRYGNTSGNRKCYYWGKDGTCMNYSYRTGNGVYNYDYYNDYPYYGNYYGNVSPYRYTDPWSYDYNSTYRCGRTGYGCDSYGNCTWQNCRY